MRLFHCLTGLLPAGISGVLAFQSLAAQTTPPSPLDLSRASPSGNYLAARSANVDRDAATAAAHYNAALKADPKNPELLELAFYAVLAGGEVHEAGKVAQRRVSDAKKNTQARPRLC